MKSKQVDTVTSNESYVRLRIFDGDLLISEAGAELLRIAQAQLLAEQKAHARTAQELASLRGSIRQENIDAGMPGFHGGE